MTTLFDSRLSDRDFSSRLLHVGDLLEWVKTKRLHLQTMPALDGFEFVQVEALLCAVERETKALTPAQAINIVMNDPALRNDPFLQRYPDDVDAQGALWILGAEAHRKWRELIAGAVASQELQLLDFASKLPIDKTLNPSATGVKWTPEKLAELASYRAKHTMPETAAKYGISEQRIRNLLPRKKSKANPFSGLIHLTK